MASADVILKYVNQTKIKGSCQSGRKVVPHDSKSDLPLTRQATMWKCLNKLLLNLGKWI